MLLGAHMSVAGGLPRAIERAVLHGCDALQIFAKNANQWRGRVPPPDEVREFRDKAAASGIGPIVSHASYLINLATTNDIPMLLETPKTESRASGTITLDAFDEQNLATLRSLIR